MKDAGAGRKSVDGYIAAFPPKTRSILRKLRRAIREAAPEAIELKAYGIPTFKQNGYLVHFAAYKGHIGFYPTPSGIRAFRKDLSRFKLTKGTVQFPMDKPLPLGLVKRIVRHRLRQDKTALHTN